MGHVNAGARAPTFGPFEMDDSIHKAPSFPRKREPSVFSFNVAGSPPSRGRRQWESAHRAAHQRITRSMVTRTLLAPGASTVLVPARSPGCGVTLPDLLTRASTTMDFALEIVAAGDIAIASV